MSALRGTSFLGVGRPGLGALPPPAPCPWGRRPGPLPVFRGREGCGCGNLSPTPQRALLRAGFARRGGGTWAPGGGPLSWVCGVRVWALSLPQPPVHGAGGRAPLPVFRWRGRCRCGEPSPTPQRALLLAGFARCGGGTRAARGVGGRLLPGCGLSGDGRSPSPSRPSMGQPGAARWPFSLNAGSASVVNRSPTPQRALLRAGFALCAGRMRATGGGHASCLGVGHPALGALPPPAACSWGRRPQPVARSPWGRGVRAWGRVTNPTAPSLAIWLCALWGRHMAARGGGRLLPWCGAFGVGRSPSPSRPSLGQAAGSCCPFPVGAWGAGVGTRHQPHSARSCELALRAAGAAQGRPGGGGLLPGGVASGVGLSPSPSRPSMGQAAGARCPFSAGRGGVGVETRHQPNCTRSCVLDLRAVGVARGCSRRGASCLDVGHQGLGALPPPAARP